MQYCPRKSRTSSSFTGEGTQTISAMDEKEEHCRERERGQEKEEEEDEDEDGS